MAVYRMADKEWKWFRRVTLMNRTFALDPEVIKKDLEIIDEASMNDDPIPVFERFSDLFLPERAGIEVPDVGYLGVDSRENALVRDIQEKMIHWQDKTGFMGVNQMEK